MDVTVLMTDSKGKIERDLDMVVEGSKKKRLHIIRRWNIWL